MLDPTEKARLIGGLMDAKASIDTTAHLIDSGLPLSQVLGTLRVALRELTLFLEEYPRDVAD